MGLSRGNEAARRASAKKCSSRVWIDAATTILWLVTQIISMSVQVRTVPAVNALYSYLGEYVVSKVKGPVTEMYKLFADYLSKIRLRTSGERMDREVRVVFCVF
jgi:hypothetical protein